jgi:Concanavalin A-like lectin/glucanases superfamily/Secretion system C-terminal sorting domain
MKLFFTTLILLVSAGFANAQTDCNSWVQLQNRFAAIRVGDLDVTGNKVTVEASFNMTGPSVNIVSKHKGGNDLNYLLRPTRAEISTVNSGFVFTNQGASPCNDILEFNKTYHAALVYDGSTLKFYRNGALISQVPASGNLITNNWNMAIGEHAPVVTPFVNGNPNPEYHDQNTSEGYYDESFRGFINEVRIWNVARTQDEIKAYMNTSLPNPATQVGLLGYWVLNDLTNRQGNAAYNGIIEGLATINQTNTSCAFIADSCNVPLPVKLTSFNVAEFEKKAIKLNWHTEWESNIRSYTIQRAESPDFRFFTEIGIVQAAGTGTASSYSFSDNSLVRNKLYYYRLKINELTGSMSYSAIKSGKISGQTLSVDFYPNPVQDGRANLLFNNIQGNVTITVLNNSGQVLINKNITAFPGSIVQLDLKVYGKGNYFINVLTRDDKIVRKMIQL